MCTGNTAPYYITQPSTDNYVQMVSPTATMATLTCSLNITIPLRAVVFWIHNNTIAIHFNQTSTDGSTTTLTIENPQSSDDGVYQCVFNDAAGSGWVLRRNIILLITGMHICLYMDHIATASYGLSATCCWILKSISLNTH